MCGGACERTKVKMESRAPAGRRRRVDGGHALHQHAVCCDGLLFCGLGVARHFQDRSVTCPRHASQAYFCGLDVAHNRDSAEDTAKAPSSSGGAGRRQLKTKYGRASFLCLGPLRPRWAGHRRERDRQVREMAHGRAPRDGSTGHALRMIHRFESWLKAMHALGEARGKPPRCGGPRFAEIRRDSAEIQPRFSRGDAGLRRR